MAEELPAVTMPSLVKAGFRVPRLLHGGQTGAFIGIEHDVALLALDDDGDDLVLECAGLDGLVGLDLAVVRELIQHARG